MVLVFGPFGGVPIKTVCVERFGGFVGKFHDITVLGVVVVPVPITVGFLQVKV